MLKPRPPRPRRPPFWGDLLGYSPVGRAGDRRVPSGKRRRQEYPQGFRAHGQLGALGPPMSAHGGQCCGSSWRNKATLQTSARPWHIVSSVPWAEVDPPWRYPTSSVRGSHVWEVRLNAMASSDPNAAAHDCCVGWRIGPTCAVAHKLDHRRDRLAVITKHWSCFITGPRSESYIDASSATGSAAMLARANRQFQTSHPQHTRRLAQ